MFLFIIKVNDMMFSARMIFVSCLTVLSHLVNAQAISSYDPQEAFASTFYPDNGNEYRTADGRPGPKYWQNRADYRISASLNDTAHSVNGSVEITYTNNSPQQ